MKLLVPPQSGSIAGQTASRNRFGQYVRSRAIPVNPNTTAQGVVRARLALNSSAWRALTAAQRAAWADLALSMVRSDSLGQSINLTGQQTYVSVNNERLAAGDAVLSDAPALGTPGALATATITLTAAAFSVAYTATPLAAGARLFTFVSPQRSAGRAFESDFRLLAVSAAAAASPANIFAAYVAKFGVPVVGNRVFLQLQVYAGGFLSGPLNISAVVA
jgi:fructose-specific component phosphotransferase system IIB-like protein